MTGRTKQLKGLLRVSAIVLVLMMAVQIFSLGVAKALAASGRPLSPVATVAPDAGYDKPNTKTFLITTTYGEKVRVVFYKDDLFRIWLANDGTGEFTEEDSYLLLDNENFGSEPAVTYSYNTANPNMPYHSFATGALELRAYVNPFLFGLYKDGEAVWQESTPLTYDVGAATQLLATDPYEYFYGGGMQVGNLSHKGSSITIGRSGWTPGTAPSPVPFYMSTKGFGVFRNTFANGTYNFTSNSVTELMHRESRFDAFYFYGPTFGGVLDGYTELTGRPSLIPRWGMGLGDASAYRQLTDTSAEGGNPANAGDQRPDQEPYGGFWRDSGTVGVADDLVTDYIEKDMPIGWMLPNDGYGCEYNKETHPGGSLGDAAEGLMKYNVRTGLWVGQPQNYKQNNYTYGNGTDAGFQQEIEAQAGEWGVRVYKIDVAWSSQYNLKGDMENIFKRMYNNIEQYGERGFLITVYGWAGGQRYATLWSGDQYGDNDYVRYHIPTITGSSMSGYPYSTSDQGAIFTDNANVYVRDLQMKLLVPTNYVMNNWGGTRSGVNTADKRPAADRFTQEEQDINRKYLKLHMQLVPYLYSYARDAYETGGAIVRPMVYNYQDDPKTYDNSTQYQYMSGDWLLAAPVYDPNGTSRDDIYLPAGRWVDYWTGEEFYGPATISKDAPLETLPMYVRGGAIIPMRQESLYDGQEVYNGKNVHDTLILDLYPEGTTTFSLYEDDGHSTKYKTEDAYTKTLITSEAPAAGIQGPLTVTVGAAVGNAYEGQVESRKNLLTIHSSVRPAQVTVGGANATAFNSYAALDSFEGNGWFFDAAEKNGILYVKTAAASISAETVVVVDKYMVNAAPELELALPLAEVTANATSHNAIRLDWDAVPGADTYDLEIDGATVIGNVAPGYVHSGLEAETEYSYRVLAKSATQTSGWSIAATALTPEDPEKYVVPKPGMSVSWSKGVYNNSYASYSIDGDTSTLFHSGTASSSAENLDYDLGGMFMIDKFTYMPRPDKNNGTVWEYKLFTSLDGVNYTEVDYVGGYQGWSNAMWRPEAGEPTTRTVEFEPVLATHFRFQKVTSYGNFFAVHEVWVYRTPQEIALNSLTTGKDAVASSVWTPAVAESDLAPAGELNASTEHYESGGGFFPSQAVDGNLSTVWRSRDSVGLPAPIDLFLPETTEVYGLKYVPPQPGAAGAEGNVTGYAVYAVNASNQKVWLAGGEWADDGQAHMVYFRPVKAKSIQFVVTDGVGGVGVAAELQVMKLDEGTVYRQVQVDQAEMAVKASSNGPSTTVTEVDAPNAFDGNTGTFHETTYQAANWNTGHWPAYFTIDLGKPRVVTKVEYSARESGSGALRGYDVYYSQDGTDFYRAGEGIAPNESRSGAYVELDYNHPYPVRYIRISTALKSSLLDELQLAHHSGGASPFAWNVGNHLTASDIKIYEDPDLTETAPEDPMEIVPVPYGELSATTNRGLDGDKAAANAIDGDSDTFWASEYGTDDWDSGKWPTSITVDLGGARKLDKIEYTPRQGSSNGRLRGYQVYYSTDGGNTFHLGGTGYGWDDSRVDRLVYDYAGEVTHIRIQNAVFGPMANGLDMTSAPAAGNGAYAYGSGNQLAIANLQFFEDTSEGGGGGAQQPEPAYAAGHAVDGNLETGWSSADGPLATLTVDFGEAKTFDYARVVWGQEVGRNFTIDVSDDGADWSTVKTVTGNTLVSSYYGLDREVTARYVRLNGLSASVGYTVKAFDVFGNYEAESITLDETNLALVVGERAALNAALAPASVRNQTILWSSDNEAVANVDAATGHITAVGAGVANIVATSEKTPSVTAACKVTVTEVGADSITLNASAKTMGVGAMFQLEATVNPASVTEKDILWSSLDEDVATVSANGFVTAVKAGSTTIVAAWAKNPAVKAEFGVTVSDIQTLALDNEAGVLAATFGAAPDDLLRMLFSASYRYGDGQAYVLELNNMEVNGNTVSFVYTPFAPNDVSDEVTVTLQYKNGAVLSQVVTVEKLDGAVIEPKQLVVDGSGAIADAAVSITCGDGAGFAGVAVNEIPLVEGADYTWSAPTLTFKAEYLETLTKDVDYAVVYSFTGGLSDVAGSIRVATSVVEAQISSVAASNGTIEVTLDTAPTYDPVLADFAATMALDGAAAESLALTGFAYDKGEKKVTLSFAQVPPAMAGQTVAVSVSYKAGTAVEADSFVVPGAAYAPENTAAYLVGSDDYVGEVGGNGRLTAQTVQKALELTRAKAPEGKKLSYFEVFDYDEYVSTGIVFDLANDYVYVTMLDSYGEFNLTAIYKDIGWDKEDLQGLLEYVDGLHLQEADYTAASWKRLDDAAKAIEALLGETDPASADIKAAYDELMAAWQGLTPADSSQARTLLEIFYIPMSKMEPQAYTADSWVPMAEALAAAKALLDKDPAEVTDAEYQAALDALFAAQDELVYAVAGALRTAIAEAETILLEKDKYYSGSVQKLEAVVAEARLLLETPEEDLAPAEVEAMTLKLVDAITTMFEKGDINRLKTLVKYAKLLNKDLYTSSSWAAFETVLTAAEQKVAANDMLPSEVEAEYQKLSATISGLVSTANKKGLQTAISVAESIVANLDKYIPSTVAGLSDLLDSARVLYDQDDATQTQVDEMEAALIAKVLGVRKPANKNLLKGSLGYGRQMNLGSMSQASGDALQAAMDEADKLLDDPNAGQDKIDAAKAAVDQAVNNLEEAAPVEMPRVADNTQTAPERVKPAPVVAPQPVEAPAVPAAPAQQPAVEANEASPVAPATEEEAIATPASLADVETSNPWPVVAVGTGSVLALLVALVVLKKRREAGNK